MLNGYPQHFIDYNIQSGRNYRPPLDRTPHGTDVILCDWDISETLLRIGKRYNVRTIFKTKHILLWAFMTTRPVRDVQQTRRCVYSIPWDCGERSRPLEVRIMEHKYDLRQGLLVKSKSVQHAHEEGHRICWN
jgi:hypothetical protein